MIRAPSSTSLIETDRRLSSPSAVRMGNKGAVLYSVFETAEIGPYNYFIHKLDSAVDGAALAENDGLKFGTPIAALSSDYPYTMTVFSVGSKIYFIVGGRCKNGGSYFTREAYMFDINSNNGTISIASMNFPKPIPFVFGPIDDADGPKVYVFSASNHNVGGPSFEILNTNKNEWKSLYFPKYFSNVIFDGTSALCGSNIVLYSSLQSHVFVFCTKSETWSILKETTSLPFWKACYLSPDTRIGQHILLASPRLPYTPTIYSYPILSPEKNAIPDYDIVGPFRLLGEVENFMEKMKKTEFLKGWGVLQNFYCFNNDSMCIVRSGAKGLIKFNHFVVDICNFSYSLVGGTEVKVKVEKTLQYKYKSDIPMVPRHFLAVA